MSDIGKSALSGRKLSKVDDGAHNKVTINLLPTIKINSKTDDE